MKKKIVAWNSKRAIYRHLLPGEKTRGGIIKNPKRKMTKSQLKKTKVN